MTDIVETDKRKQRTKSIQYEKEQDAILQKLMTILNIKIDDDKSFLRKDELNEKKESIIALYDDIKKYYNATTWRSVESSNEENKYMSIIRRVLNHHNYDFKYKKSQKIENKQVLSFANYYIKTKKE